MDKMEDIFNVFEKIEKTGSTNEKLQILLENQSDKLNEFLDLTFNTEVLNVGVKNIENSIWIAGFKTLNDHKDIGIYVEKMIMKINEKAGSNYKSQKEDNKDFKILIEKLKKTGGKDQEIEIRNFLICSSPLEGKWYARALTKNLHCGLSLKSVNKYFKKIGHSKIEEFSLGLCERIKCRDESLIREQLEKIIRKNGIVSVEGKYDGFRVLITKKGENKNILSRRGKKIETMDIFLENLEGIFENQDFSFDGEIYSTEGFQHLMTLVHRKSEIDQKEYDKLRFVIFDCLHYNGYDLKGQPYFTHENIACESRIEIMDEMKEKINATCDKIKIIDRVFTEDVDKILEKYHQFIIEGFEGAVIKNAGKYTRDRKNWWKMKPVDTVDLEIIGLLKGTGKNVNNFSKIRVIDESKTVITHVGSGLGDEEIKLLTDNPEKYLNNNAIVEVAFDSLTKPDEEGKRKLRFPRFISFRDDKTTPDNLKEM